MVTLYAVRRESRGSSAGAIPARQTGSLQPVAIGAAVEVTKPSEPSRQMYRSGDAASRQVVTRVNVEQAPKRQMWVPTRLRSGEGWHCWPEGNGWNRPSHERLEPAGPPGY
jgi:hypothetical protein